MSHIRPLRDGEAETVPGAWIADAGPMEGARIRLWISGDSITVTVLQASGTFPAAVTLPVDRFEELLGKCRSTAPRSTP